MQPVGQLSSGCALVTRRSHSLLGCMMLVMLLPSLVHDIRGDVVVVRVFEQVGHRVRVQLLRLRGDSTRCRLGMLQRLCIVGAAVRGAAVGCSGTAHRVLLLAVVLAVVVPRWPAAVIDSIEAAQTSSSVRTTTADLVMGVLLTASGTCVRERSVRVVSGISVRLLMPVWAQAELILVVPLAAGSAHRAVQIRLHRVCDTCHAHGSHLLELVAESLEPVSFHTDTFVEVLDQVLPLGQLAS